MFVLAAPLRSQEIFHITDTPSHSRAPLTSEALEKRVGTAALEYAEYAPVPRVAFFDVAYPANSNEATELAGHAVLLVTAIVQDSAEIPLQAVKIRSTSGVTTLQSILRVYSKVPPAADQIASTFGCFREDSFYLLPLCLIGQNAELLADFAVQRNDFKLGTIDGELLKRMLKDVCLSAPTSTPDPKGVLTFITREYPGIRSVMRDYRSNDPSQ